VKSEEMSKRSKMTILSEKDRNLSYHLTRGRVKKSGFGGRGTLKGT
jgi:hypothetical protein